MKIEVSHISQLYDGKKAINDISFTIQSNKIIGLLGRNGAGKTTLMHQLAGQLLPTSGMVQLNGKPAFDNYETVKSICFIKEAGNFKPNFKIREVLQLSALFYPNWNSSLAEVLVKSFNLDKSMYVKALSKGMISSLGVIVGLASRSSITIFDEPYIGMDAVARQQFYDLLIEEYSEYPRTIILSTHLIDEISNLFEEIIILKDGGLLIHEEAETLRKAGYAVEGPVDLIADFSKGKNILGKNCFNNIQTVMLYDPNLSSKDVQKLGLTVTALSIQDLLIQLTKNTVKEVVQ
ncbi:ABC transporter ATP-binding protein [Bacillus sp. FJAT-22090]|uniref:ABC transporter ATP-binding protein n=1 Tax=Bacillus sp. FJAT-22090 TaxID=1581038 RepID=UPI0011A1E81F|nr:ABC transporter ATP-binding protein [Bacillus sp. FJAT-22090]